MESQESMNASKMGIRGIMGMFSYTYSHAGRTEIHVFMGLSEFIGASGNDPHYPNHPHSC